MPTVWRVLGDAERVIEESLRQRPQEQFLIRAMLQPLDAGEVEVRPVNVRLQHAADLIRMRPRRADVVDWNLITKDGPRVRVGLLDGCAYD